MPVFVFHSLVPGSFERRLRHLARNGYATLSADEHREVLEGRREAPPRAVVLTIDDGRGSVWSVGYPLLERYRMKAVVFLVPGHMRARRGPPLPHLGDVAGGAVPADAVAGRDEGEHGLLYWEEVEELARSGHFDFQSHTLSHARVHTGPRLAGFVAPRDQHGYAAFDVPLIHEDGRDLPPGEIPLGTPLLESSPRLSPARRVYEDPRLRRACQERVAAGGGAAFFERREWESELRAAFRAAGPFPPGRPETDAEREAALRRELADARAAIEQRTGRPVRHLCHPWHASSPDADRLAAEAGYQCTWVGKRPDAPITLPGAGASRVARVGEDFLERLPGEGRVPLARILFGKLARRLGSGA